MNSVKIKLSTFVVYVRNCSSKTLYSFESRIYVCLFRSLNTFSVVSIHVSTCIHTQFIHIHSIHRWCALKFYFMTYSFAVRRIRVRINRVYLLCLTRSYINTINIRSRQNELLFVLVSYVVFPHSPCT